MARDSSTFVVISPWGKRLLTAFFVVFLLVLYLPTVLLVIFSFTTFMRLATNASMMMVLGFGEVEK